MGAEFLQKRGYDAECCPTLFCSSKCKKAGNKLHAYMADYEYAKLPAKEKKKRLYCEARVDARIERFLAEQAREKRNVAIHTCLATLAGGPEELADMVKSEDKTKLQELMKLVEQKISEVNKETEGATKEGGADTEEGARAQAEAPVDSGDTHLKH